MSEEEQRETKGKTTNTVINQQKNDTELLRLMTGYNQPPAKFYCTPPILGKDFSRRRVARA